MKKILQNSLLILLIGLGTVACNRDEKSLFDAEGNVRLNQRRDSVTAILTDAPFGWEMTYFAQPESDGYVLMMNFSKDGTVNIQAWNDPATEGEYKEEESCWSWVKDQGLVMTFNTYNSILHTWSDPQSDGIGYGGDYEFVLMKYTPNEILLKGKKANAFITLRKLSTAEADHKAYLEAINQTDSTYFWGEDKANLALYIDNERYEMTYSDHQFVIQGTEKSLSKFYQSQGISWITPESKTIVQGCVIKPNKVQLYNYCHDGMTYHNKAWSTFQFNANKTRLVCNENPSIYIESYKPQSAEYLTSRLAQKYRWVCEEMDHTSLELLDAIQDSLSQSNTKITRLALAQTQVNTGMGVIRTNCIYISYLVGNKLGEAQINLNLTGKGKTLTVAYTGYSKTSSPLLKRIDDDEEKAAKMIANILEGEWTVTSDMGNQVNQNKLVLTRGDRRIVVRMDNVTY